MIKRIQDNDSKKYMLIVEGTTREFTILIGGADLYFYLTDYEKGDSVIISKDDKETYEVLNNLLTKLNLCDNKRAPLFNNGVFEWISDAGIPEESNRLKIYYEDGDIVFKFWRNDIAPFSDCSISFCTCGAVNQDIVNELMYFFNSHIDDVDNKNHSFRK